MEQPLYKLIQWTAEKNGLLWMIQEYESQILAGLAILALICCLFGFYCYRGLVSGLTFLGAVLACGIWVRPAWGDQTAVTMCAVLGVVLAFLAFRWYKVGAIILPAAITGGWVWFLAAQGQLTGVAGILLAVLCCTAAGTAAFFFPFWSICGFTALWGGITFAMEGWRLLSVLPGTGQAAGSVVLGCLLTAAGLALQLFLFRRQKLLPQRIPERLESFLQKRREKQGVSA